jgi:galactose mutarotase-like enzyme
VTAKNDYDKMIAENREVAKVDPSAVSISNGRSILSVRLRGCFITTCRLMDPRTGSAVDILFAEKDHAIPKLMATHTMSPAGPFEGPGGQHGFPRWADYRVTEQSDESGKLTLETHRSDDRIMLKKAFELSDHALVSHTTVYNPGEDTFRTSLGEHYYYPLPDNSTDGLTINGHDIDSLLGDGTLAQIMDGDAAFWGDWSGTADIRFPAGYSLRLEASATPETNIGMLLWHKPGSGTICFEPTAGYKHGHMNTCLCLESGEQGTLTSSLTLI